MRRTLAVATAALALVIAAPALSGDPPKHPVVTYRHNVMEAMGKHMRLSSMIVKGEVDRKGDLVGHAEAMHNLSKGFTDLFPADTAPSKVKTDSKPEIWKKWDDFKALNDKFIGETEKLVEVAKGGDMVAYKAQFEAVGQVCGDCHDGFRVEDE